MHMRLHSKVRRQLHYLEVYRRHTDSRDSIQTVIQTPIKRVQTVQTVSLGVSEEPPNVAVSIVCTYFIGVCMSVSMVVSI